MVGTKGPPPGSSWASPPEEPPLLPPDQDGPQEMVGCEGQALHRLPHKHPDRSYGRADSQASSDDGFLVRAPTKTLIA